MPEAGWTTTVRDKARKLYGLLHAEVSRDQVCGPEDVKAIRKMEIVDIGLLIAALDDSYQQGRVDTLKKVTRHFDNMFGATDRRIDSVRDYRVDKFYTWLAQAAQDEKPTKEAL